LKLLITRINPLKVKFVSLRIKLYLALLACIASCSASAQIAIIIDDVGYNARDFKLFDLPPEITLSLLPHTPFSKAIADKAFARGQETMLHLPMESISGKVLEPGTIEAGMDKVKILNTLDTALANFPHVTGVNNHMGSKLTQMYQPMQIIMQSLKQKNLFFVDSRTSGRSVAYEVAKQQGVVAYRRHVFLDNVLDVEAISIQLGKVLKLANKKQIVIAIGHPHPQTIQALQAFFKQNSAESIALTKVSALIPAENRIAGLNSAPTKAD